MVNGVRTCTSTPPELRGRGRTKFVLNLTGSDYVDVTDIDISDGGDCGYNHPTNGCGTADSSNLSADNGIQVNGATNIVLDGVRVHGLKNMGIQGGSVNAFTIRDSEIAYNSFMGWDLDHCYGTTCGVVGTNPVTLENSIFQYNGCVEDNPGYGTIHATARCYSQSQGGNGDGIAANNTAGAWTITDTMFLHNVADGLDLLYHNRGDYSGGTISLKRVRSEGNGGDAIKTSNALALEDSFILANCGYFQGQTFTYNNGTFDHCRSRTGSAVKMEFHSAVNPKINSNTIFGNGDVLIITSAQCTAGTDIFANNNILIGGREWWDDTSNPFGAGGGNDSVSIFYNADTCQADFIETNNLCYAFKEGTNACNGTNSIDGTSIPATLFTGTIKQGPYSSPGYYTSANYINELYLGESSAALNVSNETVSGLDALDYNSFNRGAAWDAGAYEGGTEGGQPDPTCGDNNTDVGEVCDGTDLNSETCVTLGWDSGTLACAANCLSYNTASCVTDPCGNSTIDAGEQCDTANLNSQTCVSQGYASGTLSCTDCAFVYTSCVAHECGDGTLNVATEQCDDDNVTNGDGCSAICETENVNYQHFLANYTETDPSSHLIVTTHKVAMAGLTHNESAKVQRDFGVGYFQNYNIKAHYTMSNCVSAAWEDCGVGVISLTEASRADLAAQEAATDGIGLTFAATSNFASKTWKLVIAGELADSAADTHPFVQRYIKMTVSGTTVTVEFYEDENYTTEITALEMTGTYSGGYPRYLVVGSSYNSANANVNFSGSIENVIVSTDTPPDPPAGCTGTTTLYCVIPTLNHSASGGACENTGSCSYSCSDGVLSVVSNTCDAPAEPEPLGCTGTTTSYCIIPTIADSATGGACESTGSCSYSCSNGVLSQVSNTCDAPAAPPIGCTGTTTAYCVIPALSDSTSGGSCSTTGTCAYLCTNGTLSETSNTCTTPTPSASTSSITITGQNMTVSFH
jgi:cysteine-rich repeat protein